jgi:rod shape-determining protein MreC
VVRFLKRHRVPIAVLLSILVPLIVYRANSVSGGEANFVDKIVLAATSPIARFTSWTIGLASDSWYAYTDLADARRANGELRMKLNLAHRELDVLRAYEIENRHLAALLELDEKNPDAELLPARVIGAGASPSARTLVVDRGSMHGVRRGMPVVSGQGLVGLVQMTGWSTAEVITIADPQVAVRALVVRTRARGRVRGLGPAPSFTLKLSEVLRSDDVVPGDRVITSGLDGVFPGGVPIGEVTRVFVETGVQHRVAELEPYVDFARLEQVSVILTAGPSDPIVTPEPLRPAPLRNPADAGAGPDAGPVDGGA